jgi:hypothetical protein
LREEQFALKRQYEALRQRFEKEYPEYYDLKYRFDTVGFAEIRERVLDERTVLVEYFFGKEWVFIFTITRDSLEVTDAFCDASLETELSDLRKAILARTPPRMPAARIGCTECSCLRSRPTGGKNLVIVPDGP